jgi:hypothetical protein
MLYCWSVESGNLVGKIQALGIDVCGRGGFASSLAVGDSKPRGRHAEHHNELDTRATGRSRTSDRWSEAELIKIVKHKFCRGHLEVTNQGLGRQGGELLMIRINFSAAFQQRFLGGIECD